MNDTNLDEQKQLALEIQEHGDKATDSFKQGQAIHNAYMDAPDEHNLVEEVEAFLEKSQAGIAEMNKAIKLQDKLTDKRKLKS